MGQFKHPTLKELTEQQVRFAPPARRLEQLSRAEKLLTELDPNRRYPYQYIFYRITEFRPESYPDLVLDGGDVIHDLRLFIESLAVPYEEIAEPVLSLEEVSQRWNVSTKTIRRWRERGLLGRRVLREGRLQMGYLQSAVENFLVTNQECVTRGSRFSQLTEEERDDILRRARRLSRVGGGSLMEVSRRIARRLGRSVETVRYTIKNFDRVHPDKALYPQVTGPLDAATKQIIFSSYRRGIAVEALAKRYGRNRTSMYRVINECRANELIAQPLDYIYHSSFDDKANEAEFLALMPDADAYESRRREMKAPRDVPAELASLYEVPLLTKEQEQHLFRKMNYLKHKAAQLRQRLCKKVDAEAPEVDPSKVRIQLLDRIDELQHESNVVKDQLIKANMRLVVTIAKRHAGQAENFFELLSDGNMSLIRAVEKFDYSRGFKFSTYASWAIMKNFARSIPDEQHRRERFVTGHDELFDAAPDQRSDEHEALATTERAKVHVNRLLAYLEPRERDIIRMRAGLDDNAKGMTLEEIGQQFGITKERVRQLNARAMKKLRELVMEQHLEMP